MILLNLFIAVLFTGLVGYNLGKNAFCAWDGVNAMIIGINLSIVVSELL